MPPDSACALCKKDRVSLKSEIWKRRWERSALRREYCACLIRFGKKADVRRNACWNWRGARDRGGYGLFSVKRKAVRAPKAALLLFGADTPDRGALACHSCDNPGCVNPEHLHWGTHEENMTEKVARGRARTRGIHRGSAPPPRRRRAPARESRGEEVARNATLIARVRDLSRRGYSSRRIACAVARSRAHVNNALRLLKRPTLARAVARGSLTWTEALRAMAPPRRVTRAR